MQTSTITRKLLALMILATSLFLTSCGEEKETPETVSKDFVYSSILQSVRLGDGVPLNIRTSVRWRISDYVAFNKQFHRPAAYDSLILAPRQLELAGNVANTYDNVDTVFNSQRHDLIKDLKNYLMAYLGEAGVEIKEVIIADLTFPANYTRGKETLAMQEQELETIRKQNIIDLERAQARESQTEAEGKVSMVQAQMDAEVQKINAETEKSVRQNRLAKAETEKQVSKMRAQAEAEKKRLLALADLDEKRGLKNLEIERKKDEENLNYNTELRMARLCTENPVYATYMVNKELASKVQIAVLPNNQDGSVLNNLLNTNVTKR